MKSTQGFLVRRQDGERAGWHGCRWGIPGIPPVNASCLTGAGHTTAPYLPVAIATSNHANGRLSAQTVHVPLGGFLSHTVGYLCMCLCGMCVSVYMCMCGIFTMSLQLLTAPSHTQTCFATYKHMGESRIGILNLETYKQMIFDCLTDWSSASLLWDRARTDRTKSIHGLLPTGKPNS